MGQSVSIIGWLISVLLLVSIPSSHAAQTIFYSSLGTNGCVSSSAGLSIPAERLIAHASGTINTINVLIGAGSQTNFSTSRYLILANEPMVGSPNPGAPNALLATFTPSSISGSGVNTVAKFVGSYSFTSGTIFWVAPLQRTSVFPHCYWYPTNTSAINMSSLHLDTTTSLSNTTWRWAYTSNSETAIWANWYTANPDNIVSQLSLEYVIATPVLASVATQSGLLTTSFRTTTPLRVSVETASKVTYYANGKVIAGCRNLQSSSGIATCNWKPSTHGAYRVYARVIPISSAYLANTTSVISIGVGARTTKR